MHHLEGILERQPDMLGVRTKVTSSRTPPELRRGNSVPGVGLEAGLGACGRTRNIVDGLKWRAVTGMPSYYRFTLRWPEIGVTFEGGQRQVS